MHSLPMTLLSKCFKGRFWVRIVFFWLKCDKWILISAVSSNKRMDQYMVLCENSHFLCHNSIVRLIKLAVRMTFFFCLHTRQIDKHFLGLLKSIKYEPQRIAWYISTDKSQESFEKKKNFHGKPIYSIENIFSSKWLWFIWKCVGLIYLNWK